MLQWNSCSCLFAGKSKWNYAFTLNQLMACSTMYRISNMYRNNQLARNKYKYAYLVQLNLQLSFKCASNVVRTHNSSSASTHNHTHYIVLDDKNSNWWIITRAFRIGNLVETIFCRYTFNAFPFSLESTLSKRQTKKKRYSFGLTDHKEMVWCLMGTC